MTKPQKPEPTWLLVQPTERIGDEDGNVSLRMFIKRLGRSHGIKLLDIRPHDSKHVPKPPEAQD